MPFEDILIDEKRFNSMKLKIIKAEQENLRTKDRTPEDMIELIRRIIIDETNRNY